MNLSVAGEGRPLALITGASSGIGEAFAEALAKRGNDLVLVARRADRLQALSDRLMATYPIRATVLPCDLSQVGACETVLSAIDAPINVLVDVPPTGPSIIMRARGISS